MKQHFLHFINTNERICINVRFTPTIGMTFPFNGGIYIVTGVELHSDEIDIKLSKINTTITES